MSGYSTGYCTCGAKLPDDARFCHKCGKPQRDEPVFVEEAQPLPIAPPAPVAPPPAPIGFRNGLAVRTALISGLSAFLLLILSGQLRVPEAFFAGLVAIGFLAVYLYQRRTGQSLSVLHGAHLGWISGVFGFGLTAVVFSAFASARKDPAVMEAFRQQASASIRQADIDQAMKMIHDPSVMLAVMAVAFVSFTLLPTFGGALGAKLLHRE